MYNRIILRPRPPPIWGKLSYFPHGKLSGGQWELPGGGTSQKEWCEREGTVIFSQLLLLMMIMIMKFSRINPPQYKTEIPTVILRSISKAAPFRQPSYKTDFTGALGRSWGIRDLGLTLLMRNLWFLPRIPHVHTLPFWGVLSTDSCRLFTIWGGG